MNILRNSLAVVAASALFGLATACSGSQSAVCEEATKAFTDYSAKAAGAAGDLKGLNAATSDLAAQLKELSGKAEGDLKVTLAGLADSWGSFKVDLSDPAAATKLSESGQKAIQATQQLAAACS
ncbi:hypothetical protein GCM10010116_29610 [Microbispora rosea subsp. aerata]|nr:hypothetical protein [Microbispora rosea]GGO14666.1 hypothetical protein GCM10010116_29610 [Microbispora rosea subsp. aerata]GIH55575.1 hypothetical protein Mro02_24890 [Microbispora rosea subsp. aerata]GLJ86519.1 hypothetical protein GCM10017588_52570 [Microbispora rosea subsp. aerata]